MSPAKSLSLSVVLLIILTCSCGLTGCSSGPAIGTVKSSYDKFTDTREDTVNITTESMLARRIQGSRPPRYYWGTILTTIGREPARIEKLVILADGTAITLTPESSKQEVAGYAGQGRFGYVELVQYPITASQVQAFAVAGALEGRAYSSTRQFEGRAFTEQEHAAIRRFYEQFVRDSSR